MRVFAEPSPPGLELVNTLKISEGICPEGRAFRELLQASFQSTPPRAAFTGLYPAECGERDLNAALHHPEDYIAGMIRLLWTEMGGSWAGSVRNGAVQPGAALLYTHESVPLAEVVRDINKFSNNVMARQLYLTLAAEMGGPPADPAHARQSVQQWLQLKKIRAPELVIDNGSGLSRKDLVTPEALTRLLVHMQTHPEREAFMQSLAQGGEAKSTLRYRLHNVPVQAKTGSLEYVRTLSGYATTDTGRQVAFTVFANNYTAPSYRINQTIDRLVMEVAGVSPEPPRGRRR